MNTVYCETVPKCMYYSIILVGINCTSFTLVVYDTVLAVGNVDSSVGQQEDSHHVKTCCINPNGLLLVDLAHRRITLEDKLNKQCSNMVLSKSAIFV